MGITKKVWFQSGAFLMNLNWGEEITLDRNYKKTCSLPCVDMFQLIRSCIFKHVLNCKKVLCISLCPNLIYAQQCNGVQMHYYMYVCVYVYTCVPYIYICLYMYISLLEYSIMPYYKFLKNFSFETIQLKTQNTEYQQLNNVAWLKVLFSHSVISNFL